MSSSSCFPLGQMTDIRKENESHLDELIMKFNHLQEMKQKHKCDHIIRHEEGHNNIADLRSEHEKLKYRINILKEAILKCELGRKDEAHQRIVSPIAKLSQLFTEAIKLAYPSVSGFQVSVVPASNAKFGDYQFNSSLTLSQVLRSQGITVSSLEVAQKLESLLPENEICESVKVAGAGFLNIVIRKDFVQNEVKKIIVYGALPPEIRRKLKVVVDFSSPNIAKQMHVGHLRLLEYLGHEVVRVNHVGDWGTQFGMLIAHLQEEFPDYEKKSPPIGDLQTFYKEAKEHFDADAAFKKKAYSFVVKLQSGDPSTVNAWKLICEESRKGVLQEDEGRKVLFASGMKVPLTLVKSDGAFTYDTSDLTCLKYRIEEEHADWIIYVTDAGQAQHFKTIFACAAEVGIWDPVKVRVNHCGFGVVLGEDGKKFKTREGNTVKLLDLLDEGIRRSQEKLLKKSRDAVLSTEEMQAAEEAVAYGCIKYADLSKNRNHEYMLEDKGNTAVYILYALTRIHSILSAAQVSSSIIRQSVHVSDVSVNHPKELKLAKREGSSGRIVNVDMGRLLLCEATSEVMGNILALLGLNSVKKM